MKTIRWFLPPYFLLVFVLGFLAGTPVSAQVATQASLIEGAKKEGKVVWYAYRDRRKSHEHHPGGWTSNLWCQRCILAS